MHQRCIEKCRAEGQIASEIRSMAVAAIFLIIGDKRILRFDIAHEQVGCQEQGAERR